MKQRRPPLHSADVEILERAILNLVAGGARREVVRKALLDYLTAFGIKKDLTESPARSGAFLRTNLNKGE